MLRRGLVADIMSSVPLGVCHGAWAVHHRVEVAPEEGAEAPAAAAAGQQR